MNLDDIAFIVFLAIASLAAVGLILYQLRGPSRKRQLLKRTRINASAPERGHIFAPGQAIQLNAEGPLPEWIQIAPYGRHPTRDGTKVQVFNAEAAEQIMSWFSFWPRRLARLARLNAIKVYVGHPDFAPGEWPDRIELGSITELNADENGLNARVAWSDDALAHVTKHKFPSVAWDVEVNADETETPVMLWSVGMWHKPNIKTVQPVINAAGDEAEEDPADKPKAEASMLGKIMEAFRAAGITKEGDDDNAVLGAIGSLIQTLSWKREESQRQAALAKEMRTALNALVDVAEMPDEALGNQVVTQLNAKAAEAAALSARVAELNAERIEVTIARALETGRLVKADEEAVRAELNADFAAASDKLNARAVQLNCSALDIGGNKPAISTAAERSTRLNAWLDEYQQTHGCDRQAAWQASETDPAMKTIHAAMKAADQARTTSAD